MAATKLRKFVGMAMAALLCFALTPAAAFAASGTNDNSGSIKIENAKDGYVYKAYQILQLEEYNTEANAYLYKASAGWSEWLAGQTAFVSVDENGYVSWVGSAESQQADAAAFAQQAVEYAVANSIPATAEATAQGAGVTFTGLNLGYYVVDSSMGALCSLNTTSPEAQITEKNDVPEINKQVEEDGAWGGSNDAAVGDIVNFQIMVTGQAGAQNYTIHDTMSKGLDFKGITEVTLNGTQVPTDAYTLATACADGCTFEMAFTAAFCQNIQPNDQIVVSYSAVLNENAVVQVAETNKAQLTYGDSHKTLPSTTETYTWGMKVIKVNGNDVEQKLEGAKFTLQKKGSDELINVIVGAPVDGTPVYTVVPAGTAGAVTEMETTEAGEFFVYGLDAGTYELVETQAPTGFNKMTEPTEVTISKDAETGIANIEEVTVENLTGLQLPSTGGMGTTVLYIVGGVLVLGAIIFLVRRRSSATK